MVGGLVSWSGGGLGLWALSSLFQSAPPPPPSSESLSRFLNEWDSEGLPADSGGGVAPDDCGVFDGTLFDERGCSQLSVGRVGAAAVGRALGRAMACAAAMETDCILGEEVGLLLPVAFVYDNSRGMRALLAPKVLGAGPNATLRRVRLLHPSSGDAVLEQPMLWNSTLRAEFLERSDAGVVLADAILEGSAAYCVQLLRSAYSADCWAALD
jgi:hypothetical protein